MNPIEVIQEWNTVTGVPQQFNKDKIELYAKLIQEEHKEWEEAYAEYQNNPCDETYQHLLKELADKIVVETGQIHCFGESATQVLKQVNDSNFSKFISYDVPPFFLEKEREVALRKYANKVKTIFFELVGKFYIMKNQDGKVLKSTNYKEADMSQFKLKNNEE